MRKSQSQAAGKKKAQPRPDEPPPPPPRTSAAKQRAEASFGNRKPSNSSRPAASAEVPPTGSGTSRPRPNTEYFETNKTQQSRPVPDPLSQFREQTGYTDSRQSTPYTSHGGEKFNTFDGVPQRTKSGRENQHGQSSSHGDQQDRSRSSSMPRQPRRDDGNENLSVPPGEQRPSTGGGSAGAFAKSSFKERTGSNNGKAFPSRFQIHFTNYTPQTRIKMEMVPQCTPKTPTTINPVTSPLQAIPPHSRAREPYL